MGPWGDTLGPGPTMGGAEVWAMVNVNEKHLQMHDAVHPLIPCVSVVEECRRSLAVRACSRREAFVHISLHVSSTRNVVDAFVQIPEKLADLHGKYKASFIHMAS